MTLLRFIAVFALCGCARAQAPSYSINGIVNASDYTLGPFAPNSAVSIFGTGLSWGTEACRPEDLKAGRLPMDLAGVQVHVGGWVAPLLFVSPYQINFIVPSNFTPGDVTVRVVRQSLTGPEVKLKLLGEAPALFNSYSDWGYAVAQRWPEYSLIDSSAPAHPGDVIILYATGLGRTQPALTRVDEVPMRPAVIERLNDLRVLLDGSAIGASRIIYAGLTPQSAAVYQINITLPDKLPENPEIRVAIGNQISAPGIRLAVK